jgi:hypothetical protein
MELLDFQCDLLSSVVILNGQVPSDLISFSYDGVARRPLRGGGILGACFYPKAEILGYQKRIFYYNSFW